MCKSIINLKKYVFLFFLFLLLSFFLTVVDAQSTSSIKELQMLEAKNHLRIGVSALNMKNHEYFNYRSHERFAMDSTSKLITVAAVLYRAQNTLGFLNRKILVSKGDSEKSGYSPVTQKFLGRKMSISSLCQAAIEYSDNTAANLLMSEVGGPKAITKFARSIGDKEFNLVRWEPYLNSAIPGDIRDTTTPHAMLNTVKILVFGHLLNFSLNEKLIYWMRQCKTGAHRIRAAIPNLWLVGDKTGTGYYGSAGDIAIIWPPKSPPILLSIYISKDTKHAKTPDKVFALATKIALHALLKNDLMQHS